jgi:hypothetical protein
VCRPIHPPLGHIASILSHTYIYSPYLLFVLTFLNTCLLTPIMHLDIYYVKILKHVTYLEKQNNNERGGGGLMTWHLCRVSLLNTRQTFSILYFSSFFFFFFFSQYKLKLIQLIQQYLVKFTQWYVFDFSAPIIHLFYALIAQIQFISIKILQCT